MAELLLMISDVRCLIFGSGAVWGMGIELGIGESIVGVNLRINLKRMGRRIYELIEGRSGSASGRS